MTIASRAKLAGSAPRLRLFLAIGSLTVIGPAAMDIYLPGLPDMSRDLSVSASTAQLTVTTFLVGLALGQFLAGPVSDMYGRRIPLTIGMSIFALSSIGCALAPDLPALATMRLLEGTTAATGMAIGRAVVRDLYSGSSAARYLSRLMLIVGLGPTVAPLVGAQILRVTSWRGVFLALVALGVVLTATSARVLPETLPRERRREAGFRSALAGYHHLLRHRNFVGYLLVSSIGSGAILGYIAGSSFVFEDVYGASPQLYSVLFASNALFMVAGAQINANLLRKTPPTRLLRFGTTTLVIATIALFAATQARSAGLVAVVPALMLLMFSWSFIQSNAIALALSPHPEMAGTASALLGMTQFGFGGLIAPLVEAGGDTTAVPMAVVMCLCSAASALSLHFVVAGGRAPALAAGSLK